jgi:L-lactate dehydrogenase complex protein LldE
MSGKRVSLLPTCVVDTVAPQIGQSVVRVLRRAGFEVSVEPGVTCCGQPAWNSGFAEQAAAVAATTLDALASTDADVVCVPAGSCATMMRVFWPELFHVTGDETRRRAAELLAPRVREFSELVASAGVTAGEYEADVAYHHSCHMLRELGIRDAPVELLEAQEGTTVVPWEGDDRCCGFGGLFSVKQPELSSAMADDKLEALAETDATVLVGCDASCLLHLEGRLRKRGGCDGIAVRHLAEVLDEAGQL